MQRLGFWILFSTLVVFAFSSTSTAGWLVFHKPAYNGRTIDAETKEPVKGVVIVAMYRTHPIISGPAGGSASIIHIKETLTDEKGEFHIPSYTTSMGPNTKEDSTKFIIYKPGYGSYPKNRKDIYPFQHCGPGYLFSKQKLGTQGEIRRDSEVVLITFGIAELPNLKTREERLKATPSEPSGWENKVPFLLNTINEERKNFGLGPIGPVGRNYND